MTQENALNILKTGASVFLTGEPGAGKTFTINKFIAYLRERGIEPAITASTGIAATHIGGMTVHSWSGIGIKERLTKYDLDRISTNERVYRRLSKTHVLIIDEVSMLRAETLAMIDAVCRAIKQNSQSFGGMQVILVGDFFQLPPVQKEILEEVKQTTFLNMPKQTFAFESDAWRRLDPVVCYLSEQYRQDDPEFLDLLGAIRRSQIENKHLARIRSRIVTPGKLPVNTTKLFSHNADVDEINLQMLAKITEPEQEFQMIASGPDALVTTLKRGCLSPQILRLKKGAVVMCTKNNSKEKFVNGTLGTVENFNPDTGYPLVRKRSGKLISVKPMDWSVEENGKIKAKITQVPLRLAWAITVHKSQGMSMDAAVMDLSRVFEYGQGYVALSRVRRLSGLHLVGINDRALEVHPAISKYDGILREQSSSAHATFSSLPDVEMTRMHERFIKALGGKWKPEKKFSERQEPPEKTGRSIPDRKERRWEQTLIMIKEGKTISEVAKLRGRTDGTILEHLEQLKESGLLPVKDIVHILINKSDAETFELNEIHSVMRKLGGGKLKPIHEYFNGKISYETIRLARLFFDS